MKRLIWYVNVFGFQGLKLAFIAALFSKSIKVKIYCRKLGKWIFLRTKTSDLAVYEKVIINEEYKLPSNINPSVIVDAGANVGISALFFAINYPESMVIAIEPELSNFEMLRSNVDQNSRIHPVRAAVWCENESLNLFGQMNSDFQVGHSEGSGDVEGLTIDELMSRFSLDYIDVLKVDIEGAEKEVFEKSEKWIDYVGMLVIELHDRFKPGCEKAVRGATPLFNKCWEHGENSFFTRDSDA